VKGLCLLSQRGPFLIYLGKGIADLFYLMHVLFVLLPTHFAVESLGLMIGTLCIFAYVFHLKIGAARAYISTGIFLL
jgi:hypothetical protein